MSAVNVIRSIDPSIGLSLYTIRGWMPMHTISIEERNLHPRERGVLFDEWLKENGWEALEHLERIGASGADMDVCASHIISMKYAPWRPYAIAYALSAIDQGGVSIAYPPPDIRECADFVSLDNDPRNRLVVGIWTRITVILPAQKQESGLFFEILPTLQKTNGVGLLRVCFVGSTSNVIEYYDTGHIVASHPHLVNDIVLQLDDVVYRNGIWVTRNPGCITLTTGAKKQLSLRLNPGEPYYLSGLNIGEMREADIFVSVEDVVGSVIYVPQHWDIRQGVEHALNVWARNAGSLADWEHDPEEGVDVAGDIVELFWREINSRLFA